VASVTFRSLLVQVYIITHIYIYICVYTLRGSRRPCFFVCQLMKNIKLVMILVLWGAMMGLCCAMLGNVGAMLGYVGPFGLQVRGSWPKMRPSRAKLGPSWGQVGPSWIHVGPSWGQVGAELSQVGSKLRPKWCQVSFNMQSKKASKAT